jgi:Antibiotic biosynthesis monooxygenase
MSVYVVIEWSVPEGREAELVAALAHVRDHIAEEHPAILSTHLYRQWTGDRPHRAYRWAEEYASFTALEADTDSPACDEVWRPVRTLIIPVRINEAPGATPLPETPKSSRHP